MWKLIAKLKPKTFVFRRALYFLCIAGIAAASFFWGRRGVSQTRPAPNAVALADYQPTTDASRRVVAKIYGNINITREELGEYLIARFGKDRIYNLVNQRIIEKACHDLGIYVTDTEVQAQLDQDLRALGKGGVSVKDFETKILRPYHKTMYEWREDVLRPQIYMNKLAAPEVRVDNTDLQKLFEARYGPMVKVRMIVLPKDNMHLWAQISEEVRSSEEKFQEYAKKQFMQVFAAKGGEAPPVHKNFGYPPIEHAAFRLKVGEVSDVIGLEDKTAVILKCDGYIAARTDVSFERERTSLYNDVYRLKLNEKIAEIMARLKKRAEPYVYLDHQVNQNELQEQVERELRPQQPMQTPGPLPKSNVLPAGHIDPSKSPGPPPGTTSRNDQPIPPAMPFAPPGTVPLPQSPPIGALQPGANNDNFAPVPVSGSLDLPTSPTTGFPLVTPPLVTPIVPAP